VFGPGFQYVQAKTGKGLYDRLLPAFACTTGNGFIKKKKRPARAIN
jgi:hypothetical protein